MLWKGKKQRQDGTSSGSGAPREIPGQGTADIERLLDGIEWGSLTHAYGHAADTPAHLQALATGDASDRARAYDELCGSIWHQNTVYEATAPAVGALVQIARKRPASRFHALALLMLCAEAADTRSPHRKRTREAIAESLPDLVRDVIEADDIGDQHGQILVAGIAAMLPEFELDEAVTDAFMEVVWGSAAAALLAARELAAPSPYPDDFPTTAFVDLAYNAAWPAAGNPPLQPTPDAS